MPTPCSEFSLEAFVSLTLIVRLILKKPNWLGALFRGIPGRDGDIVP